MMSRASRSAKRPWLWQAAAIHALYLISHQLFNAAAGVVWLMGGVRFLRFAQNDGWGS
jgi:hypothetical protein